jgi:hypothetical protein
MHKCVDHLSSRSTTYVLELMAQKLKRRSVVAKLAIGDTANSLAVRLSPDVGYDPPSIVYTVDPTWLCFTDRSLRPSLASTLLLLPVSLALSSSFY